MPRLINIDYNNIDLNKTDNAINFFIPLMAKNAGFQFKEIMNSPTSKILDGYIIGSDGVDKSEFTLRFVQNELWKRILINSRDMLQSKGTKNAIRSIFNSIGVIPEDYYRFREYGQSNKKFIEYSLLQKTKNIKFINFFNTNNNLQLNLNLNYLSQKISYINDSYSIEFFIHYPFLFLNNIINDTLFSLKNTDNIDILKIKFEKTQQNDLGILNAVFYKLDGTERIIPLSNINLLNNRISHISLLVDNQRSDLTKITFNLQYCSNNSNLLTNSLTIFKLGNDLRLLDSNLVQTKKIEIGNNFKGQISNLKIWKNLLSNNDLKMHALDIQSLCNHELQILKFKKISDVLLLDLSLQDDDFYTYNSDILPIDFSENSELPSVNNQMIYPFKLQGINNILPNKNLTFNTIVCYENDFKFDEPNVDNKVNILSLQDVDLTNQDNIQKTPIYEINYDKQKKNDVRFSIEMSNVKHLNEDIGKLFDSIDFFADIISDFGSLNDSVYNKFEKFADFYFQRIKSTTLQISPLYDLYQIFDNVLTEMLSEFISSRVKFNNNVF